MNVLGIDQSITHTVIHARGGARPVAIKTNPKDFPHGVARLQYISERFSACVTQYEPGYAYIEGYAFSRQMAHTLGELGGQMKLELYALGWAVVIVPPNVLKKFVTGSGSAEKSRMQLEVFDRWKYKPTDDNDADAYALLKLGEAHQRVLRGTVLNKADLACIASVEVLAPHTPLERMPKTAGGKAP